MASEVRLIIPAAVTPAQAIAELEISDFPETLKALIKERLLHPSLEHEKQINFHVDCLRKMAARFSLEQPILAQTTWQKIQKIAVWLQNSTWLTESQEALNQIAYHAALANKTIELDLKLFGSLPEDLRTPSISGLIACCQISANLKKPESESFLSAVEKLIEKALFLLPLKGKQVCLTPWIDAIFRQYAAFDRRTHEEEQRKQPVLSSIESEQMLTIFTGFPAIQQALERLKKREILCHALRRADDAKNYSGLDANFQNIGQIFAEESADAYQKNSPYWQELLSYALMFYHAAKKYCPSEAQGALISNIKKLEATLQKNVGAQQLTASPWKSDKKHQRILKTDRQEIYNKLEKIIAPVALTDEDYLKRADQLNQLQHEITQRLKSFINALLLESIQILGNPPCKYAMIGFGSLGKQSSTLYSDLEFGFLIEPGKDTKSHQQYFRNLTHLLHAKVIALGETPIPKSLFECNFDHLTGIGICFDLGGKTPLGRRYEAHDTNYGEIKYELIGEPKKLIEYVGDNYFAIDPFLPVQAAHCTHIAKDAEITAVYKKLLVERFTKVNKEGKSFYQQRALALLKGNRYLPGDLEKYNPSIELEHTGKLIDVKKSIYRFPDRLIDGLAFFFGIQAEGTCDKIERLSKEKIIHADSQVFLKIIDGIAKELRLKTYHRYGEQRENVALVPSIFRDSKTLFHENQTQLLQRFYATALPLHTAITSFCDTCHVNFEAASHFLIRKAFNETSPLTQVLVYRRLGNYAKAQSCLLELNISLKDPAMLFNLGVNSLENQKPLEAKAFLEQAVKLYEKQYGKVHPKKAKALVHLSIAHRELGNPTQAKDCCEAALLIEEKHYGTEHHQLAMTLNCLSNAHRELGNAPLAKTFSERALEIEEKHQHEESPDLGIILGNLGNVCGQLGDNIQAKFYFKRALVRLEKYYGKEHPSVATNLVNLGNTSDELNDVEEAKIYFERALTILENYYNKEHPQVASTLLNLGSALGKLGNFTEAKINLERGLAILEKFYGKDHLYVAQALTPLGIAFSSLKDEERSKISFERALAIEKKFYGNEHPQIGKTLYNLGLVSDPAKAKVFFEQALKILKPDDAEDHSEALRVLSKLVSALSDLNNFQEANRYTNQAIAIYDQARIKHSTRKQVIGKLEKMVNNTEDERLRLIELEITKMQRKTALALLPLQVGKFAIPELIELALQLDCGMYNLLDKRWQNPGVAGLCAFRLVADKLASIEESLAMEVQTFLQHLNKCSEKALIDLEEKGPDAFIKPLMNELFEYAGGFQRELFAQDKFLLIKQALKGLPKEGQLCYRPIDGRFFVLVDDGYIEKTLALHTGASMPRAVIGHAHVTVNEGMSRQGGENLYKKLLERYGIETEPLFKAKQSEILYLKKKILFSLTGAYAGIPKTNSRAKKTLQLVVAGEELAALAKEGLGPQLKDYWYHITFADELRNPFENLYGIPLKAVLKAGSDLSKRLGALLFT